jgi:hypothetical protein
MTQHQDDRARMAQIEAELTPGATRTEPSRRAFIAGAAGAVAAATLLRAESASAGQNQSLAASPPAGFTPFSAPGTVVRVSKSGCMQENQRYPKPDDAKAMLEKVMTELTGKPDLVTAVKQFVHPQDKVCVKVNGIALQNMGTNKELVLPFLEAMIAGGVPAGNITVLEQYGGFLGGTRISADNVPKGVQIGIHGNGNATMPERMIPGTGTTTQFTRFLTEATCAINFALVKDHSICGYTGALKNMTHGCSVNPHAFHAHEASPQIALLYAQDVIKSRVRLCIADAFKVMAQGGPLWKSPQHVKVFESVMASTDPVALDTIGWEIVEKHRADFGLKKLAEDVNPNHPKGREPTYISVAAQLGLGVADRAQIKYREVTI